MQPLKEERNAHREVDDRFTELRLDRVSGAHKFKKDQAVDVISLVKKSKETFAEQYQDGTFYEVKAYAMKLGWDVEEMTEAQIKERVFDKFGLVVEEDCGKFGYVVMDQDEGTYRVKRGGRTAVASEKKEKYTNKDMQVERVQELGKDVLKGGSLGPLAVPTSGGGSLSSLNSRTVTELTDATASQEDTASMMSQSTLSRGSAPFVKPVAVCQTGLGFGAALGAAQRSADGDPACEVVPASSQLGGGSQKPGLSSVGKAEVNLLALVEKDKSGKRRRTSTQVAGESAQILLEKMEVEMTWSEHWHSKSRRRDFDAMISRLTTAGRKCGAFLADEVAMGLSARCFTLSEKLESRQEVIEDLRGNFAGLCESPPSQSTIKILQEAPMELLGSIMTQMIQTMVDKLTAPKRSDFKVPYIRLPISSCGP